MADVLKKVPVREQDPKVRATNFEEVCYGYNQEEAMEEASRCINCKNAKCIQGCPVGINIPAFVHEVKEGNIEEAYKIIGQSSALPAVCGRVCPQESQCEGKCIRGIKGESISIGKLERFVADYALEHDIKPVGADKKNGHKVAVIGSGPAGLTCAGDLAKLGYDVTVFEALHELGGVLVYGIPEFRLPKQKVVAKEIAKVKAGIIKKGCPVVALKQGDSVCEVIKNKAEECGSRCVLVEVPASVEENVMTEQGQRQGRCIQDRPIQKQCIQYPVQGTTLQDVHYGSVHTALGGIWQRENLSLALAVLKLLEESDYSITKEAVQSGIAKTIWHGRYEVLQTEPLFIIDGAHNPIAAKRLKQTIEKDFTNREIIYIIGVLADKEHEKMLRLLLPGAKAVFTVTPDSPRALDGESLAKEAQKYADNIWYVPDIGKAVKMAKETAKESDVILAVGSLSYLKEVKKALGQG